MIGLADLEKRLTKPRPGRAILFTGAGFSFGAINSLNAKVPLAREFAARLAQEIGEDPDLPLTLISEIYNEKKQDPFALLELLKATFTIKEVPEAQRQILAYPWKRIYTTNYDDLAEHILSPDGTRPESFSRNNFPSVLESARRQIVHINGFVGEIDRESLVDDFALTLSSYMDKNLFSSDWASTIRQDFELSDIIVFAGYSLYDTDISNILGQNPTFRGKTVAIQPSSLRAADQKFLGRFGSVLTIGNEGLAGAVTSVLAHGAPTVVVAGPENFRELVLPPDPPKLATSDVEVDALLGRGIYNRKLFVASCLSLGREYLIARSDAKKIAAALSNAGKQVLMHSEIGNGKSLLVEHASVEMLQGGMRVFLFERRSDNFSYDIEYFAQLSEPYVLVVEEMISNDDVLEAIHSQLTNARVLSTSRSSAFQVKFSEIKHLFSPDVQVIDVNKLSDSDVDSAIKILNTGAYWNNFPDVRTAAAKRKIIEKKCRRELSSVLLGVVKSQALDKRVGELFQSPSLKDVEARRVVVLALCLNVIEMRPTFELLSELLEKDIFSTMSALSDQYIRQFFAVSGVEVLARSPIMSSYLLNHFVSDEIIVDVVVDALRASSDKYKRAKRYKEINAKFLQFSFIEQVVFEGNNKYARIQDFYDRAGDIGFKEFSPHFWLQYAIAARAFKDFKAADRYFSECKKIADRRSDFYTYQIDNAYAQFLLESRKDTDHWSDFFDVFREAATLAMQQTYIQKAGIYPYRVVARFLTYLEVRNGQFSKRQKTDALEICRSWLIRIDGLPDGLRRNTIVKRARATAADSYDLVTDSLRVRGAVD